MKRFLLPLAIGAALSAASVVANAFESAYVWEKANKRVCLVPEAFSKPRVYFSAIKPNGKCDGTSYSPIGGTMNTRFRRDLSNSLWAKLQEAAIAADLDPNFDRVYCRTYLGNGSKIRFNPVVREAGGDVSGGWWPDASTKCIYNVPLDSH